MASRRKTKKEFERLCDSLISETTYVTVTFGVKAEDMAPLDKLAVDMYVQALSHMNVSFDRTPGEFASGREYRIARRAYFSRVYRAIKANAKTQIDEFFDKLHTFLPEKLIKEF